MKSDIRNIINFESITKLRSSIEIGSNLPPKNRIVKLIPIQLLEQGVKVLIDGKLFIAFIDGKIPIKEELIAIVTNSNPYALSLNLNSQLSNDNTNLIDQVIKKFELRNNTLNRRIVLKVIEEGHIVIKSKILLLTELLAYIKANGLGFSLLINLVWNNNNKSKQYIDELYSNLFDESFETVSENLLDYMNSLLFASLPQYLNQQISESLIFDEEKSSVKALLDKSQSLYEIIKLLNEVSKTKNFTNSSVISNFIYYATKYILQKSVLKDYDYYPDFVIIKRNAELTIVHFTIKKIYNVNNQVSYKVVFTHDSLPFDLQGIIRNNFLIGDINAPEILNDKSEITSLQDRLKNWGIYSDLKINDKSKNKYKISKLNKELNELIS